MMRSSWSLPDKQDNETDNTHGETNLAYCRRQDTQRILHSHTALDILLSNNIPLHHGLTY